MTWMSRLKDHLRVSVPANPARSPEASMVDGEATGSRARVLVRDVRYPHLPLALISVSAIVFVLVLYYTSYVNFYFDEWDFAASRVDWSISSFFLPHNEHWSTLPILVWKVLLLAFGLRTHVPYEAALLAVHVSAVLLLFELIRRRSGPLPAFVAALILLVFGSGGTDITWAFQIGFVGSVTFGLLAMLILDGSPRFPRNAALASLALLGSLMCSSVGLAFVVAVAAELAVDAHRRRFLIALVVPLVAFGEWFFEFGAGLAGTPGAPCPTCSATGFSADLNHGTSVAALVLSLGGFITAGLESSAVGVFGVNANPWAALLPVPAALLVWHWYRQRGGRSWQFGMIVGAVAWFALIGFGRALKGPDIARDPHYIYVGAVFLLPLLVDGASELPWQGLWKPALLALVAVSLVGNIFQLRYFVFSQVGTMSYENAELQTAGAFRGAPDMAPERPFDDQIMPTLYASNYFSAIDRLGSPVAASKPEDLKRLPVQPVDQVMVNLFGWALTAAPDNSRPVTGLPCKNVDATNGSLVQLEVPDGQSVMLQTTKAGDAFAFLSYVSIPGSKPLLRIPLAPGTHEWIYLPNTGKAIVWRLTIRTTPVGVVLICGPGSPHARESNNSIYSGEAAVGSLDPNWTQVADDRATAGRAARAVAGNYTSFRNDTFGAPFVPIAGTYDVWFRARVKSTDGLKPEMTLGVWDDDAIKWLTSSVVPANQASTGYSWIRVAAGVVPKPQHTLRFLASVLYGLSTDWFVDEAVMVPTTSTGLTGSGAAAGTPHAASAATGDLYREWMVVQDSTADGGRAIELPRNTVIHAYTNASFGGPLTLTPGKYDVWYRVRVADPKPNIPELTLGLWDDQLSGWAASLTYAPNQLNSAYEWVKVGASIAAPPGNTFHFIASFTAPHGSATLSTDWYIDQAVAVPTAAPVWPGP